ncbi:MAG: DNA internalization-related competence protein ComEC/Rec2 [Acidobacteriota bacterium]
MGKLHDRPALLPAVAVALGVSGGLHLHSLSLPLVVALGCAGVAVGGSVRRGWVGGSSLGLAMVALAAGLTAGTLAQERAAALSVTPGTAVPVEAVGRVAGPWRRLDGTWRSTLTVERLGRGRQVHSDLGTLLLDVTASTDGARPKLPPWGARVRALGSLRRAPGYRNGGRVPSSPPRLRVKSLRLVRTLGEPTAFGWWMAISRHRIEGVYDAHPSSRGAALARALLLGDSLRLPEEWVRGLRRAGLAHLLAVSGLHLGLVALLAGALARPLPPWARGGLILAACAAYSTLVGGRTSVLRAFGMAAAAVTASGTRRPPSPVNALAWVAAALLLDRPERLHDLAFQLTVGATFGLLVVAPTLGGAAAGRLRKALAATVGAQLASLPILVPRFGVVGLFAPVLNLVAVPWTALSLAVGLLWTLGALIAPESVVSEALLWLLDALARPFQWPSTGAPRSWGSWIVSAGGGTALLAALLIGWWLAAGSTVVSNSADRPPKSPWLRLVRRSPALLLALWFLLPRAPTGGVEVVVLDVGQGDAILLRDGSEAVLVDGGGWRHGDFGGRVLVPALAREGLRRLTAVVMTHPDTDHCAGLVDLLARMPVGEVWVGAGWPDEGCAANLKRSAGRRWRIMLPGEAPPAVGRWRWTHLAAAGSSINDRSLVLRAEALGRSILLTGDIGFATERALALSDFELASTFLKVAHHGSKNSSGGPFLAAVRPRLAVVSAGVGNHYGHPARDTLERLRRQGVRCLRTDRLGAVRLAWSAPDGPVEVDWAAPY